MRNLIKTAFWTGMGMLALSAGMGSMNTAEAKDPPKIAIGAEHTNTDGHYETRYERVLVGGETQVREIPAVYETRTDSAGNSYQHMVSPARTERVILPARWVTVERQVYVPDSYTTYRSSPSFHFGFGFGSGHRHHDHYRHHSGHHHSGHRHR